MAVEWKQIKPRRVGKLDIYTGTAGTGVGWFDDFDGKWVYLSLDSFRTIGNASSGAAIAADWLQTLYAHFWDNYTTGAMLTSTGGVSSRGASASADWSANKRLTIPDFRGRTIVVAGTGSSLTARTKGDSLGEEDHILTTPEMPSHVHGLSELKFVAGGSATIRILTDGLTGAVAQTTDSTGGGEAHNNMQPSRVEHLIVSAGIR